MYSRRLVPEIGSCDISADFWLVGRVVICVSTKPALW